MTILLPHWVSISRTSSELESASRIGIEEDTTMSLPSSRFFAWYVTSDGKKKMNFAVKRKTMHPIPLKMVAGVTTH